MSPGSPDSGTMAGLLSPTLSSKGGEGELTAHCSPDTCNVQSASRLYLPTLSVRATEVLGKFWPIGAARFGAVPLDLGACSGTGREVSKQQELSDRGGVFEVGASWLPRFAALQEMSDRCALDSRDALGRNRKCPVRRLGQDPGPLAIASRVHDTPAADIERPAVKAFPEIRVIPLLEICQHGWVIGEGNLTFPFLGLTLDLQLGSVVPVDLEFRHQTPRRDIPPDHAGLRILLPVAAHRAETFNARGVSRGERPEHAVQVMTAPIPQAARAEVPIIPPVSRMQSFMVFPVRGWPEPFVPMQTRGHWLGRWPRTGTAVHKPAPAMRLQHVPNGPGPDILAEQPIAFLAVALVPHHGRHLVLPGSLRERPRLEHVMAQRLLTIDVLAVLNRQH